MIDSMVAHGMRAEIKTGNLLTGQKYVAVDVVKGAPPEHVDWDEHPPIFPTASGGLDEIQDSIGSVAKKLDKVPFDQISARLLATMASSRSDVEEHRPADAPRGRQHRAAGQRHVEGGAGGHEERQGGARSRSAAANDLGSTLIELSRAASSVSALADYLERHPEALIRGKPADPK